MFTNDYLGRGFPFFKINYYIIFSYFFVDEKNIAHQVLYSKILIFKYAKDFNNCILYEPFQIICSIIVMGTLSRFNEA